MEADFGLTRLRGDNPLGFLAALGALHALNDDGVEAFLYWEGYTPYLKIQLQKGFALQKKLHRKFLIDELYKSLKRKAGGRGILDPTTVVTGKIVGFKNEQFLKYAGEVQKQAFNLDRRPADLLASYCVLGPKDKVEKSNWILTTGQGHQDFLEIARNVVGKLDKNLLEKALFGSPIDKDKGRKISFRFDPDEDRRYALTDSDPSGEETLTSIGANALAFEALRSFPAFVMRGDRLGVVAWDKEGRSIRWPLWHYPIMVEVARSLLSIPEIWSVEDDDEAKEKLLCMGIFAVLEAKKIFSGNYRNLSPGTPVWFGG